MMSRLSQLDRDKLNVLRISQDQSEGWDSKRVNFEISIRGETAFEEQASFYDLGLPENLDVFEQGEIEEPPFRLPSGLTKVLPKLTVEYMSDRTLWLDIDLLDKHLAIVPWERLVERQVQELFGERSSMNILRVPELLFLPAVFGRTTNIVLIASERQGAAGESRWQDLAKLIWHIFDSGPSNVRVHVFTDTDNARRLEYELSTGPVADVNVLFYFPDKPWSNSLSESARSLLSQEGQLDNEWLTWIASELRDVTVDVVHFLCDGFMSLEQGGLVFAASPRSEANSERERFANAQQIDFFLTRIGAYSVALTAAENCSSVVGLRLLSTQLARLRTGPVLLHEARSDQSFTALCIAYRFLYTHVSDELKLSEALTLHCAPTLIHRDLDQPPLRFADSLSYLWGARDFLKEATANRDRDREEQVEQERERESLAWAVAAYRFMEKMAAGLNREESTVETEEARQALIGMREAINLAADSVHVHARHSDHSSE